MKLPWRMRRAILMTRVGEHGPRAQRIVNAIARVARRPQPELRHWFVVTERRRGGGWAPPFGGDGYWHETCELTAQQLAERVSAGRGRSFRTSVWPAGQVEGEPAGRAVGTPVTPLPGARRK